MEIAQLIILSLATLMMLFNGLFFVLVCYLFSEENKASRQEWKQLKREIKAKKKADKRAVKALRNERKRNLKKEQK